VRKVKDRVNPTVAVVAVVIVALLAVFLGFRYMNGPGPNADKKGEDEAMKKVQSGQPMYTPPAGAPVPGAPNAGGAPGFGGMAPPSPPKR